MDERFFILKKELLFLINNRIYDSLGEILKSSVTDFDFVNNLSQYFFHKKSVDSIETMEKVIYIIKKELGTANFINCPFKLLINKINFSQKKREFFLKEIDQLNNIVKNSQEFNIRDIYISKSLNLPWDRECEENIDIKKARKILNHTHYGLEEIKMKILSIICAKKYNTKLFQSILLVGPPGVGKTTICKSISHAMGRPIVHLSMGGISDPQVLLGIRRGYVGADWGLFLQSMSQLGVNNGIIHLDEVDKMKSSCINVLLSILDFEQNHEFFDHYLNTGFNFSKTFFILTANDITNLSPMLLDRCKIINIKPYTIKEKKIIISKIIKEEMSRFKIKKYNAHDILEKTIKYSSFRKIKEKIQDICLKIILKNELINYF